MTLKELIIKKREDAKFWKMPEDLDLTPDQLEMMMDELRECEEFKDTDIRIMKYPVGNAVQMGTDKNIIAKSVALYEGAKFGKRCFLYKIGLTPKMYSPDFFTQTEGSYITPTLYNPNKFTPFRKLVLDCDLEKSHDSIAYRKHLHDVLDDMLDHPEAYDKVKSERGIILRGDFEYYSVPNESKAVKI